MMRSRAAAACFKPSANPGSALRRRAEASLLEGSHPAPGALEAPSPEESQRTLHELQVHQLELEMQNEELCRVQAALDAARVRYFDLYDLAPVGDCILNEAGLIVEANFAAAALLGWARGALIGQPLHRFISQDDQDAYYLLCHRLAGTGAAQSRELRVVKPDGSSTRTRVVAAIHRGAEGASGLRIVLVDLGDRG